MVAEELAINDRHGIPLTGDLYCNYGSQPHSNLVQDACQRHLVRKHFSKMKPGDVITLRNPSMPCHAAIVSEIGGTLYMIHAYDGGPRKVVEHIIDFKWNRRVEGVFEFPGVSE